MAIFAVLATIGVLAIYIINLPEGKIEASSAAFSAIVMLELVNVFLVRQAYSTRLLTNHWLFIAVIGTLLLQLGVVLTPSIAGLFSITQIDVFDWILITVLSLALWLIFSLIQIAFPVYRKI